MEMQPHLLTVITFLPLLGVPALLLLRSDDHTWIKRIALAVSLAEFVISLFLLRGFDHRESGLPVRRNSRHGSERRFTTTWEWTASAFSS